MNRYSRVSTTFKVTLLSLFIVLAGCSTGHNGGDQNNVDGHHDGKKSEEHGDGGKDHHESLSGKPGDASAISRTVKVDMDDTMRYTPDSIEVKAGETIRFEVTNSGKIVHEFVIGSNEEILEHHESMKKFPGMEHDELNSVSLETTDTGEVIWQFTNAGTFNFACLQPGHYEAGMKGSFMVK